MPEIKAIRGLRYDLGHVGALADVVAPPYDVIDADQQQALYDRHESNVVRLILNREEASDDEQDNRYTRAGKLLTDWTRQGVMQREPDPAIYVYHQVFTHDGQEFTRRGFICGVKLERFGEGTIYPHEQTHAGPKADRLNLIKATATQLSPIFGIYPDAENVAQELLEEACVGRTPLEVDDGKGTVHRMWPVTDVQVLAKAGAAMSGRPTFVADGHHRYETACNYRDLAAGEGEGHNKNHPVNHTLMMFVSMDDPGMIVLPTHRLFRGVPAMTSEQLIAKLGDCFETEPAGEGPNSAPAVWEQIEIEDEQGMLGLYTEQDQRWTIARITDVGRDRLKQLAPEQSDEWRELGVSILHRLVMDELLDQKELPKPLYSRDMAELVQGLERGDAAGRDATGQISEGGKFNLAALVMPASLDHVRAISEHGERMPAKSTFFYPKLLTGLVLLPLTSS